MHSVDLREVAAQGAARTHLYAPNRLQAAGGLRERRVARRFAGILFEKQRLEIILKNIYISLLQ